MNEINTQAVTEELPIELDENGMVVLNDPELLKLVAGGINTGPGPGGNVMCGWHMK